MILVGIDVGYVNMGVFRAVVDDSFYIYFRHAFRSDITLMRHNRIPAHMCQIPHTRETCDRVAHFIQDNEDILEEADCILIERQPPMGLKDVEALIMSRFRNKAILISPNKLHKFLMINTYDYEERKVHTEKIAREYLSSIYTFTNEVRRHDMADAACMCIFHADKLREQQRKKEKLERIKRLPFDEYAFIHPGKI